MFPHNLTSGHILCGYDTDEVDLCPSLDENPIILTKGGSRAPALNFTNVGCLAQKYIFVIRHKKLLLNNSTRLIYIGNVVRFADLGFCGPVDYFEWTVLGTS